MKKVSNTLYFNYMFKKFNIKSCVIPVLLSIVFLTSCRDEFWSEHYSLQQSTSNENLMEIIEKDPELTKFAEICKATGYDKILSESQSYTVWAPTNAALAAGIDADSVTRFLENHIARFNYSTADLADISTLRIRMLNGKSNSFSKGAAGYVFGEGNLVKKDVITKNGVLHTIDQQVYFFKNIWENVNQIDGVDSIGKYLSSFDINLFDADLSTEIGTSPQGIVYDSVFIYSNPWLTKYGRLHLEDSVYTMILPDNNAWTNAYETVKSYFKTYDNMISSTTTTKTFKMIGSYADSLQRAHTYQAMVHDLVFRGKQNVIPADSLVSTNGNVFHQPAYLFAGAEKIESSNGLVYKVSSLNYKAAESWQKEIVVEAENNNGREFANASLYTRVTTNDKFLKLISEKKYIELSPSSTNPSFQPEVTLEIPNTLAATYNIYCVVVPANDRDTLTKNDSTKVSFQLTYVGADGIMKTNTAITKDPVNNVFYETSPTKMSKLLIAKAFKFPFANYTGSPFATDGTTSVTTVKIKVKTNVSNTEFTSKKYTRNLRVDCFILEPAN